MPCIAEYSGPSSSLTLLVIREKVAEGIQNKGVCENSVTWLPNKYSHGGNLLPRLRCQGPCERYRILHFTRVLATE